MAFKNTENWRRFCDWIAGAGHNAAREVMSAYIEENFEHFQEFVENYTVYQSPKKDR